LRAKGEPDAPPPYAPQPAGRVLRAAWPGMASWFRVQGLGFRVQGLRFEGEGSGFKVQGSGFRVQGSGFTVKGLGFGVYGVEHRARG